MFASLEVLAYCEGLVEGDRGTKAVAGLVAKKVEPTS